MLDGVRSGVYSEMLFIHCKMDQIAIISKCRHLIGDGFCSFSWDYSSNQLPYLIEIRLLIPFELVNILVNC
ncbi:hypothetical protein D3C80_624360 [compost metagenome]